MARGVWARPRSIKILSSIIVEKIGLNLKLIVDHLPQVKIIATGSSSFDLAKDVGEPLTGRKYVLKLFPLAQMELSQIEKLHETTANLEARLLYGSYPEVVTQPGKAQREEYLRELVNSYLLKDILALEGIRHSHKLVQLPQLVAFQIGKEVSLNELGTQLGMSKNTVERYLDLLEKVFVVHRMSAFSRNLRKEISKNSRFYFYEMKWQAQEAKPPQEWLATYSNASFQTVHRENYLDFISPSNQDQLRGSQG